MPDLLHSLQNQDMGHLHIVAGLWGIELESNDPNGAAEELAAHMLDPQLAAELLAALSPEARAALGTLAAAGGRLSWAAFVRQFSDVREMGAGKRDREKPHLNPASAAEVLYYRALLARAFFDTEQGPQEFAYIPDDLLRVIKHKDRKEEPGKSPAPSADWLAQDSEPLGRAAAPAEKAFVFQANDRLLDDATTLLAALRLGHDISPPPKLTALLHAAGLIKKQTPQTEKTRIFLEAPRAEALKSLIEAWKTSEIFNELRLMPGLVCEGEWANSALDTRKSLLGSLALLPRDRWWSLAAFIRDIKQKHPDFQRPAGDYDSWFIRRAADGQYLRGFACWDQVDGALVRFFIVDVLHWLGMADLASASVDGEISAFRIAAIGNWEQEEHPHLRSGLGGRITDHESRFPSVEAGKLKVLSNGRLSAPRSAPRSVRYQLARFCEWDEEKPDEYRYHITPQSLLKAKEQGLKVEHLLALLAKNADAGIPPVLVKALKRWEINGTEARAESQVILRVSRPEVLEQLRKSKAGRFLGKPLGPAAVVIKAGAQSKVMAALAELGVLAEDATGETSEV